MIAPLLLVEQLSVRFGDAQALDGISYSVDAGETLAIVGEAGSGKSVLALAMLGLTRSADITGAIWFGGRDLAALGEPELRPLRGEELALITADALHPFFTVGRQVAEGILAHRRVSRSAARDRAIDMLELAGLPEPHRRVNQYPHELSDSMRQRVMVAIAIANEPKLLLADEPAPPDTIPLLKDVQQRLGAGMVVFSRCRGAVAELADQLSELRAGRIYSSSST